MTGQQRSLQKAWVFLLAFLLLYGDIIFPSLLPSSVRRRSAVTVTEDEGGLRSAPELFRQRRGQTHFGGCSLLSLIAVNALELSSSRPPHSAPSFSVRSSALSFPLLNPANSYAGQPFLSPRPKPPTCRAARRGVLSAAGLRRSVVAGCPSFLPALEATRGRPSASLSVQHRQKQWEAAAEDPCLRRESRNVRRGTEEGLFLPSRGLLGGAGGRERRQSTFLESLSSSPRSLSFFWSVTGSGLRPSTSSFPLKWVQPSQGSGAFERNKKEGDVTTVGEPTSLACIGMTERELNTRGALTPQGDCAGGTKATVREGQQARKSTRPSSFTSLFPSTPGKPELPQGMRPCEAPASRHHRDPQLAVPLLPPPSKGSPLSGGAPSSSQESPLSVTSSSSQEPASSGSCPSPSVPSLSSSFCRTTNASWSLCPPSETVSLSGPACAPPPSLSSSDAGPSPPCTKRRLVKLLPNFLTYARLSASLLLFLSLFYPKLIFARFSSPTDVASSAVKSPRRRWFQSPDDEAGHNLPLSWSPLSSPASSSPSSPSLCSASANIYSSCGSMPAGSPYAERSCILSSAPATPQRQVPASLFSAAVFVVASLTDFLDGYLARKFNACTPVGALLDALTDKLLVTAALGGICSLAVPPFSSILGPPATVIFMREIAVQGLRLHLEKTNRGAEGEVQWLGKAKTALQMLSVSFLLLLLPLYTTSPQSMPAPLMLPSISSVMTNICSLLRGGNSISLELNGQGTTAGSREGARETTPDQITSCSCESKPVSAARVVCSGFGPSSRVGGQPNSMRNVADPMCLPLTDSLSSRATNSPVLRATKEEVERLPTPQPCLGRELSCMERLAVKLEKATPGVATTLLLHGCKPISLGSEACARICRLFNASCLPLVRRSCPGGLRLWLQTVAIRGRNLLSAEFGHVPRSCANTLLRKTSSIRRKLTVSTAKNRATRLCGRISQAINTTLKCTLSADGLPTALTYSVLGLWGAAFLAVISGGIYFKRAMSGKTKTSHDIAES